MRENNSNPAYRPVRFGAVVMAAVTSDPAVAVLQAKGEEIQTEIKELEEKLNKLRDAKQSINSAILKLVGFGD